MLALKNLKDVNDVARLRGKRVEELTGENSPSGYAQ